MDMSGFLLQTMFDAMPCDAMPCHAMLCHVMPCYAMFSNGNGFIHIISSLINFCLITGRPGYDCR